MRHTLSPILSLTSNKAEVDKNQTNAQELSLPFLLGNRNGSSNEKQSTRTLRRKQEGKKANSTHAFDEPFQLDFSDGRGSIKTSLTSWKGVPGTFAHSVVFFFLGLLSRATDVQTQFSEATQLSKNEKHADTPVFTRVILHAHNYRPAAARKLLYSREDTKSAAAHNFRLSRQMKTKKAQNQERNTWRYAFTRTAVSQNPDLGFREMEAA